MVAIHCATRDMSFVHFGCRNSMSRLYSVASREMRDFGQPEFAPPSEPAYSLGRASITNTDAAPPTGAEAIIVGFPIGKFSES